MLWLLLDLDELPMLAGRLRLFSLNHLNLVDFRDRDHGDGSMTSLRIQIEQHLRCSGLAVDGGAIRVLCMPRVLGTVFNPLSVFFCYRADGRLQAMLYEVHNTFGERHSYLIPVAEADPVVLRQCCAKALHVSPFMDMTMTHRSDLRPGFRKALAPRHQAFPNASAACGTITCAIARRASAPERSMSGSGKSRGRHDNATRPSGIGSRMFRDAPGRCAACVTGIGSACIPIGPRRHCNRHPCLDFCSIGQWARYPHRNGHRRQVRPSRVVPLHAARARAMAERLGRPS
jgi:hypothetical protein